MEPARAISHRGSNKRHAQAASAHPRPWRARFSAAGYKTERNATKGGSMALEVRVNRINRIHDEERNLKAFVDIEVNDLLLIKGFQVMNGKKGIFVSMPRQKGKDGRWYDIVKPIDPEVMNKIKEVVLAAYEAGDAQ
jgi:DNA-binding cell septation regulator SpoVG